MDETQEPAILYERYADDDDDTDSPIHACTPFCPVCRQRLYATGVISFAGAYVDKNGFYWPSDDKPHTSELFEEMAVDEITMKCHNEACSKYDEEIALYFCYGNEPACQALELVNQLRAQQKATA